MLGIIGGTVFFKTGIFDGLQDFPENTKYGTVYLKRANNLIFIPRHGQNSVIPPHKINHRANIFAMKNMGVTEIIGVNSCGSLKKELKPGKIVVPHDYVNLFRPETYFDEMVQHVAPGLSEPLRKKILAAAKKLKLNVKPRGVYVQTIGPRFETRAEAMILKGYGYIAGMTMAGEATLAREIGLEYASICSVDNFVHGIGKKEPSQAEIVKMASKNAESISNIIAKLVGGTA